jgi:hypothetical protein
MTAVMRRLACLLLVLIAIPAARADLQPLASAAHEYRSGLYNLQATELGGDDARAELQELMAGTDQAAAEGNGLPRRRRFGRRRRIALRTRRRLVHALPATCGCASCGGCALSV